MAVQIPLLRLGIRSAQRRCVGRFLSWLQWLHIAANCIVIRRNAWIFLHTGPSYGYKTQPYVGQLTTIHLRFGFNPLCMRPLVGQ
jgi:hypothetical protein